MPNPIRHHHVPQTYLKNFSFKKKKQYKIFTLDKFSKKIFEANIDDVAVEKTFIQLKKIKIIIYGKISMLRTLSQ